jgi:ParB-like chromosome segregation protein Spo0J
MRVDLGDETLDGLVDSLRAYGQLQPIVIDAESNLIGGGRRFAAATKLGWTHIAAYRRESMSEDMRAELELEENIRRKNFSWQERCLGIAKCHRLKRIKDPNTKWGSRETGEMLGVTYSQITKLLKVGQLLEAGDPEINACENITEAFNLLITKRAREAQSLLASREMQQRAETAAAKAAASPTVPDELDLGEQSPVPYIDITANFHNEDCIKHMKSMKAKSVDHIITDIPYGIDMDMVQLKNIDLVEAEHDVEDNIKLFEPFLKQSFRVLRQDGYCLFFYDLKHDAMLRELAAKVGFLVCAWPLVWCKQHACKNDAAHVNWTKATEYVMVLRKTSSATLAEKQSVNYVLASAAEDRKRYDNPFAKPETVWRFLISAVARKGQTILDPFAGEMSCPLAVIAAGCQPYAIELVPAHFQKGIQHVQKAYKLLHKGRVKFV